MRNSGRPRPMLMQPPEPTLPAENGPRPPTLASGVPEPVAQAAPDMATAARRIVELERKVGQQALELDFFRAVLRHVREARR